MFPRFTAVGEFEKLGEKSNLVMELFSEFTVNPYQLLPSLKTCRSIGCDIFPRFPQFVARGEGLFRFGPNSILRILGVLPEGTYPPTIIAYQFPSLNTI